MISIDWFEHIVECVNMHDWFFAEEELHPENLDITPSKR
jgi:hypothetical protein